MNPYDADTHPGPYLVVEVLGVGDVSVPALAPGPGEPLHQAATRVIEAAAALDERHESVLYAVRRSQRLLEGIGRGEVGRAQVSYALLRTALPELGDVRAQQDRAYSQLVESLSAYRRLPSSPEPAQRATNRSHGQGQKTRPDRDDDWAVAGGRGLVALEAVAAGGVRFRRNAIGEDPFISREKAQQQDPAVFPQTVQRLVADGLLHQDTTENVYRPGQLLSLTSQGEAALRDGRATTSRVSAALGRTTTQTTTGTLADSAATPAARTSRPPAHADLVPKRTTMPTTGLPPTFSIASIDAQRVEEALARIGPKWTAWTAMTLAQVNGPMRVRDLAAQLPFVSQQFVGKRLATMHALEVLGVRRPSDDPLLRCAMHTRTALAITDNAVTVHQDRLHALSRHGYVPDFYELDRITEAAVSLRVAHAESRAYLQAIRRVVEAREAAAPEVEAPAVRLAQAAVARSGQTRHAPGAVPEPSSSAAVVGPSAPTTGPRR